MNTACTVVGIGVVGIALGLAPLGPTPAETAKVAKTIVNKSANIRPNELVLINGGPRDQQLLEDIAVEVRKLGAHPLITFESDRLMRRLVVDVPERFDTQEAAFAMQLAEIVDAMLTVEVGEDPMLLADVDPQRLMRRAKADQAVYKRMLERNVIQTHLGNGLYPTTARAKQFGISKDKLAEIFWDGVNADSKKLQATGERVKRTLSSGRRVRITAPNGTDLKLDIARRPVFVSDGVISNEDRYAGGPACQVWLPAGEVYVTPVPATAQGTFVVDTFFYQGKLIEGLKLVFAKGKLTSMTAKGDIGPLKKAYDAAPPGREIFAALDIGINPEVKAPAGSRMVTWMAAGTISVGIGGNTWAGGDNEAPFNLYAHLTDGTLQIDGRTLIEQGELRSK